MIFITIGHIAYNSNLNVKTIFTLKIAKHSAFFYHLHKFNIYYVVFSNVFISPEPYWKKEITYIYNIVMWLENVSIRTTIFFFLHNKYLGKSEVLLYFGNVKHNLAPLDPDAELASCSLCATCQICLVDGLEHSFRPTWPCLIIELLATQVKKEISWVWH